MVSHSTKTKKKTGTLAVILLIPPLILFLAYAFTGLGGGFMTSTEKQESLLSNLPSWAQHYTLLIVVSIILCLASMILASGSYKRKSVSSRIKMLIVILISIVLLLFDIGQLI